MSKFAKPIFLPDAVHFARVKRNREVLKFAGVGFVVRLSITLIELTGFYLTQSLTLYADAVSTLADIFATAFLVICLKMAQRPPDKNHPFGHGRYEPLGGFFLGVLLVGLGVFMLIHQSLQIGQESLEFHSSPYAALFPLSALILLEICYRLMVKVAVAEHSPALAADAMHYRIDSVTSLLAVVALLASAYFPSWKFVIDEAGAFLIAVFMIFLGIHASRENFHQLTDRIPDPSFFSKVRAAAHQVDGVRGTEKIRIQSYGPDAHVNIDVEVEPCLTVDSAHEISRQVRLKIQETWPAVRDVTVHIEPFYVNDN
jgi:cation diffusion facilitator family transporter